jgi:hypothetical protein
MKRNKKPDLMLILAVVVGLGVIASSVAQGMLRNADQPSLTAQVSSTQFSTNEFSARR